MDGQEFQLFICPLQCIFQEDVSQLSKGNIHVASNLTLHYADELFPQEDDGRSDINSFITLIQILVTYRQSQHNHYVEHICKVQNVPTINNPPSVVSSIPPPFSSSVKVTATAVDSETSGFSPISSATEVDSDSSNLSATSKPLRAITTKESLNSRQHLRNGLYHNFQPSLQQTKARALLRQLFQLLKSIVSNGV